MQDSRPDSLRDSQPANYTAYLIVMATAGWALASYDLNLLVLTLPRIARDLHLSQTLVGLLGTIVYLAQFVLTIFVGSAMDRYGRKLVWMLCLALAAVFTGLTYFVQNYWQLALVRALASGLAFSELAVSITIVNEQVPARWRGLLYSVVQGGWPLGVFLAAGVNLVFGHLGWRVVFLLGVLPILAVILGRLFIRESERFEHLQQVRTAHRAGDRTRVASLLERHDVDVEQLDRVTIGQLFSRASPDVRRQVIMLTIVWLFYSTSFVATNFYITDWLTTYKGFDDRETSVLLFACGGIGFFFYILGGWLGEIFGRRNVLIVTGILTAPLNLAILFAHTHVVVELVYFMIYQATNGTWSGAGYAYQGESFPTRVRGTAIGFLGAMQVLGFIIGTAIWTSLIGNVGGTTTWLIVAVGGALGLWLTLRLRDIPPGQDLEAIAT